MFIDFGFGETYDAIIEMYLGNQLIQKQSLNAPEEILKAQFLGLMQQISQENSPMSVKMIISEIIWDKYKKKEKVLENYVEFRNRLMEG